MVRAVKLMGAALLSVALSAPLTVVQAQSLLNPCALYANLKTSPHPGVVKVQVLGNQNGIVGVMILGMPKRLNVTFNGMDVSKFNSHSQQIICGREVGGEMREYDLRSFKISGGYFQVQADRLIDGMSVTLQP